jgi:5-methyltetrahydropteroyltriglutamate--homocysteine methyltransferase
MAEIEILKSILAPMEVAVGLVDVKNTWVEPAELVAARLRLALQYIDPERLSVTPDCGFSQTARHVAVRKLTNMVAGVRMVRESLKR